MSDAEKLFLKFLPEGTKIMKAYQDGGHIKADVLLPGMADPITCTLKKNHAGDFFVE